MLRRISLVVLFLSLLYPASEASVAGSAAHSDRASTRRAQGGAGFDWGRYRLAEPGAAGLVRSSSGGVGYSKTACDTFYIYGGPDNVDCYGDADWNGRHSLEGLFQTQPFPPGGNPDPQGWTSIDLTAGVPFWRATTTNAQDFAGADPGNHGAMSNNAIAIGGGYDGYGNAWNDWILLTIDLVPLGIDSAGPSSVQWTCDYVHDTEVGYDFLHFDAGVGESFQTLLAVDGSSYADSTGSYDSRFFDSDAFGGIEYAGNDYANGNTAIVLRLRVTSDGAWSDEDGLWPTMGRGAAGVDNVVVRVDGDVVSDADFEPSSPKLDNDRGDLSGVDVGSGLATEGWTTVPSSFVGDFAGLVIGFQDLDPCRENPTPQWGFIDDGTPPNNGGGSTGGSVSSTWNYGVPGGWVVTYDGGLSRDEGFLNNAIWSPPIYVDLPGFDDDVANGGFGLDFTVWNHLPLINGIFRTWGVRSHLGDGIWTEWRDHAFVYYGETPSYVNFSTDVSEHIVVGAVQVQIQLTVLDLAHVFDFPGNDATPAPLYDNVKMKKFRIGGPLINSRNIDFASDGFPQDGSLGGSIRWDANFDVGPYGGVLIPGDSVAVSIQAVIPGTELADPVRGGVLRVAHLFNPDFGDDVSGPRAAGLADPRVSSLSFQGTSARGWKVYTYETLGGQATVNGVEVDGRFFFDLPDGPPNLNAPHQSAEPAVFYPGDVMHYYFEAADDQGNVATLPDDVSGFLNFEPALAHPGSSDYDRLFTVRGLPGVDPGTGDQPDILFWNDFGHRGGENDWLLALAQNGYLEGVDFDTYTTKGPSSLVGNGLGSAGHHGANPAQMAGYEVLLYESGNLSAGFISDGSDQNGNGKSDDVGLLDAWHNQPADRFHAYFGDDFASGMVRQGAATQSYLNAIIGVDAISGDVRPIIDDQTAPLVVSTGNALGVFTSNLVAFGGCLALNDFDHIAPFGTGPVASHEFTGTSGTPYDSSVSAGIWWDRTDGLHRKITTSFPYGLLYVREPLGDPPSGPRSTRALLLRDILGGFDTTAGPPVGDRPARPKSMVLLQNHPNPFNPRTTIRLWVHRDDVLRVRVYDIRGRLVRVLHDGWVDGSPEGTELEFDWDGRDDAGVSVASGVYLYKAEGFGSTQVFKMALVR